MYACHTVTNQNTDEKFFIFSSTVDCPTSSDMLKLIKPDLLKKCNGVLPPHLKLQENEEESYKSKRLNVSLSDELIQEIARVKGSYSIAFLLKYVESLHEGLELGKISKKNLKHKLNVLEYNMLQALLDLVVNSDDSETLPAHVVSNMYQEIASLSEYMSRYIEQSSASENSVSFDRDMEKRLYQLMLSMPPKHLLNSFLSKIAKRD